MGGLVSGIFDLFSGDPAAKEEGMLGDLGKYETGTGEGATTAGLDFYKDILSGDPTKIAEVLTPEIKSGQQQVQQQAEQNAFFGNRAGGTNASTNAAQSGERANIINLIGGLQQGAAGALTNAGTTLLGEAPTPINSAAGLKINRQNQVGSDVGGIAQEAAQIATGLPWGGSGADPYQTLYNAQHAPTDSIATVPTDLMDMQIQ